MLHIFVYFQIHPWLPIVTGVKQDDEEIEMVEKGKENKVEDKKAEEDKVEAKLVEENDEK